MSESIANRLGLVEQKLDWMMSRMRMKAVISSGVLGSDGKPTGKIVEGSMLDLFNLEHGYASDLTEVDAATLSGLLAQQTANATES